MLVDQFSNADVMRSYAGKKVFITGHTGFKGAWLSLLLTRAGAVVKGYALAPDSDHPLFTQLQPRMHMESVTADIRDADTLRHELHHFAPDFIFHLAAQPLVLYSYLHPVETFEVNVMGTAHLLEAMRTLRGKCTAVVVTTDKVYENNESGLPFSETDPLGGHDPYSSSKAAAEILTQSYQKSFFATDRYDAHRKAVATARAGNVIGGGDRAANRIVPDLVKALENGEELTVRNPSAIRPWQHVLDPLAGYLRLALLLHTNPQHYTGSYNFGPAQHDQCPVKDLVEMAIRHWGSGHYHTPEQPNTPHEAASLRLDIKKAHTLLRWNPVWNTEKAVEKTMLWYKNQQKKADKSMDLCIADMEEYFKN